MLETILDRQVITAALGVCAAVGILSKCAVNLVLRRLVSAAGNMGKSEHPLMRLVRAKFEHACMVSEKVENVGVFVDKYLYNYRVLGIRLHSLRRLEKAAALACVAVGLLGAGVVYGVYGMNDLVLRTGAIGTGIGILVYVFHLTTDENYRIQMARNYMVDFLENVCLHRYEKAYAKDALQRQGLTQEEGTLWQVQVKEDGALRQGLEKEEGTLWQVQVKEEGALRSEQAEMDGVLQSQTDMDEARRQGREKEDVLLWSDQAKTDAGLRAEQKSGDEPSRVRRSKEDGAQRTEQPQEIPAPQDSPEVGTRPVPVPEEIPDLAPPIKALKRTAEAEMRAEKEAEKAAVRTAKAGAESERRTEKTDDREVRIRRILEEFMA